MEQAPSTGAPFIPTTSSPTMTMPPGKDLDDKPGNQDLGGNSDKSPGEGNGTGQGQDNGVGFGVASGKARKLDDPTSAGPRMAITSESGKPMKSDDYDLITELEALLEKHKSRMLEKPSSKDIEDKPGNHDLGGNSGKNPG